MESRRWMIAALLVTVLSCSLAATMLFAGCCRQAARQAHTEYPRQPPVLLNDEAQASSKASTDSVWTVIIGSEGGFTGGGSGQTIRQDGTVESWSRLTPDQELVVEPMGHAAPDSLQALARALSAPELAVIVLQERGNMTTFLELQRGRVVRRFSWAERGPGFKLPAPVRRAYEAARAAARSAQGH